MIILSPSILGADFTKLGEQVAEVDKAGAQYIHLDVMDGAFVPSISFGMPVIKSLRPVTDRVFDVHMMVEEPGRYVEDIKKAGADLICVHQEACLHLDRTIAQIREAGLQTGVALSGDPGRDTGCYFAGGGHGSSDDGQPGIWRSEIYSIYGRKNQEAARNVQREGTFHPH